MKHTYRKKTLLPVSAEDLFNWHLAPGAFEQLSPPWEKITMLRNDSPLQKGSEVHFKVHKGPFSVVWEAKITEFDPPHKFVDEQIKGPFKSWIHTHTIIPHGETESYLEDEVVYENPLFLPHFVTKGAIERLFNHRHGLMKKIFHQ